MLSSGGAQNGNSNLPKIRYEVVGSLSKKYYEKNTIGWGPNTNSCQKINYGIEFIMPNPSEDGQSQRTL